VHASHDLRGEPILPPVGYPCWKGREGVFHIYPCAANQARRGLPCGKGCRRAPELGPGPTWAHVSRHGGSVSLGSHPAQYCIPLRSPRVVIFRSSMIRFIGPHSAFESVPSPAAMCSPRWPGLFCTKAVGRERMGEVGQGGPRRTASMIAVLLALKEFPRLPWRYFFTARPSSTVCGNANRPLFA
jgi:hypothetical protein